MRKEEVSRNHVLLTCLLPYSQAVVDLLAALSMALHEAELRLIFLAPDPDFGVHLDPVHADFEVLAGGLAAYASPGADSDLATVGAYARRLVDVDANWGTLADAASVELSRAGIVGCRQTAEVVFARYRPVVALLWSAALFPASRIWRDVARECGVLSFNVERGFLPGTWMLDSEGMLGHSDALISPALRRILRVHSGEDRFKQYRDWYLATRPRKYGKVEMGPEALRDQFAPQGKVVCAFGGLDAGTSGGGLLESPMGVSRGFVSGSSILAVLQQIDFDPSVVVLFKAHPGSAQRIRPGIYGRVQVLSADNDPIALMQIADVVVAGSTSLAYEATLLDRSVVLTCPGPLKGLFPMALDAATLAREIASALVEQPNRQQLAKRHSFLDGLLTYYLFATQDGVTARSMHELVEHLVEIADFSDPICTFEPPPGHSGKCRPFWGHSKGGGAIFGSVYFDGGRGFSERDMYRWDVSADTGVDSHIVPVPQGTLALRLDPADCPCIVRVIEASWLDTDFRRVHTARLGDLVQTDFSSQIRFRQVGQGDVLDLVCTGDDPHFLLPIPDLVGERLKRESLQLRLIFSVSRYAKGVALRPPELFEELRANTSAVMAALVEVEGRQQEGQERLSANLDDVWQRLHTQLGDAAHTLQTAQQQDLQRHFDAAKDALLVAQQGLRSMGETQQAYTAQLIEGQRRIEGDLLTQLSALQATQNKQTADLAESGDRLALARSKLALLSSCLAIRLMRSLCRLPKDIFSA